MTRARSLTAAAVWFLVTTLVPVRASAQSEVVEYYALDAIGSVRVVFDANGGIKSRRDYAPFGEAVSSITTDPKMYAQLFRDDESTLDYAQARMYQSGTGRFTAVDPVYAGLFNPQGWNRYVYAANSPLVFVDPEGLNPDWCTTTYCEVVTAPSNPLGFFYQPPIYGELPFTFFPRLPGGPVRQSPPTVSPTAPPPQTPNPAPDPSPSPTGTNPRLRHPRTERGGAEPTVFSSQCERRTHR